MISSRRGAVHRTAFTVLLSAAFSLAWALPSSAIAIGGPSPFGLTPAPQKDGLPRPYFQLGLAPGASTTDQIVISNLGKVPETLRVSPSNGATAPNSGIAYTGYFHPCTGVGCWITGLPTAVTLGAGASRVIPFTVSVPSGTVLSQYLAGITAEPAVSAPPVVVGGNGQAKAQAKVIDQITVGVAVTVGNLAQLQKSLAITGVVGSSVGSTPRLLVRVHNSGQRFANGTGQAVCTSDGRQLSYPVLTNTILPGDLATVPVNAVGIASGSLSHCTVSIPYGSQSAARWVGTVTTPVITAQEKVHTGRGQYSSLPPSHLPAWVLALLIASGATVVALAVLLLMLLRSRRRTSRTPERGSTGVGVEAPWLTIHRRNPVGHQQRNQ